MSVQLYEVVQCLIVAAIIPPAVNKSLFLVFKMKIWKEIIQFEDVIHSSHSLPPPCLNKLH